MSSLPATRGSLKPIVLGTALVALLTIGFAAILTPEVLRTTTLTYVLASLLIATALAPVAARVLNRTLDIADLSLWYMFVFVAHFGLSGFYTTEFGSRFLGIRPGDSYLGINVGILVALFAVLCFWAAYLSPLGKHFALKTRSLSATWDGSRTLAVALCTVAVGWAFRLLLMQVTAGGIVAWITSDKDKILLEFEGLTYVAAFGTLAYVGLLALYIGARILRDPRLWTAFWVLFPVEMAFRFLSGSRNQLVFFLFQLLMAYCMTSERNFKLTARMWRWTLVIVALLAILYPVTTAARVYGVARMGQLFKDQPEFATPRGFLWLVGDRLHGLESLSLIMRDVPAKEDYTYGEDLYMKAIAWVPRAVWADKPRLSQGQKFREELVPPGLYGEGASVAITMPGEFYWSWGVGGVAIGMLAIGVLWRFLNQYLVVPRNNASNALMVATLFPTFLMAVEQEVGYLLTFHLFIAALTLISIRFLGARQVKA
jgi:hypothetical protein